MSCRNRFYRLWLEWALVVSVGTGSIGLTAFACQTARQDRSLEPDNPSGDHTVIRAEVVRIWLPPALIELAHRRSQSRLTHDGKELQRFLELPDHKDLWFAFLMRGHLVNGQSDEIIIMRWPCRDSREFPELSEVLATAAGNPPRDSTIDLSSAVVHVIPDKLLKREPREVIAELPSEGN
jgi:hypothetical protein